MPSELLSAIETSIAPAIANHLWQSTLVAVAAALLTLTLRNNQARVRYWLWLTASIKFLIPFSILIGIGSHLTRSHHASSPIQSSLYFAMDQASQPFTQSAMVQAASTSPSNRFHLLPSTIEALWLCGFIAIVSTWITRWRRISQVMREAALITSGRELETLRRIETTIRTRAPLQILRSQSTLEPGIFGIRKPVLLWPAGISQHLEDAHLEAILTHELRHVRRRDNLAAVIHMLVEAIFWFHPLVWFIGLRLVEERERACDEEVLQLGKDPHTYAESILKTCEYCIESPLPCLSGITGADLKKRIVHIMSKQRGVNLNFAKKMLLTSAVTLVVLAPLVFGLAYAAQIKTATEDAPIKAPELVVISIRPNKSGGGPESAGVTTDSFVARNIPLRSLIWVAYDTQGQFHIPGIPAWANDERYDITGKVDDVDIAKLKDLSFDQRIQMTRAMTRQVLAKRFNLTEHTELRELPAYALVLAKGGSKMKEVEQDKKYPKGFGSGGTGQMKSWKGVGGGEIAGQGISMKVLAQILSTQSGRTVLDKTGLAGIYDFTLSWMPDDEPAQADTASGPPKPSLFIAVQEQLGLKLEPVKTSVETFVIDHVERPSAN
jgi:bla regulator protein BlaR1